MGVTRVKSETEHWLYLDLKLVSAIKLERLPEKPNDPVVRYMKEVPLSVQIGGEWLSILVPKLDTFISLVNDAKSGLDW